MAEIVQTIVVTYKRADLTRRIDFGQTVTALRVQQARCSGRKWNKTQLARQTGETAHITVVTYKLAALTRKINFLCLQAPVLFARHLKC